MVSNSNHKYPKLKPTAPTIDSLYPDYSPEEKAEAEDTFKRYVALVWRIYHRISREKSDKFDGNPFKR